MSIIAFIISLTGATMLLLYAVRMVGTGIERAMGPSFKRLITAHKGRLVNMALVGVLLAVILQSATAAALLATGFSASGMISFVGGLALVLGADLGSALVIQILSFKLAWLIPVLLTVGGYLFLKVENRTPRQVGRILLGIAFILLSLRLIGEAVHPIREAAFMPAIAGYLANDFVTAFIVGAVITFAMHSSVAAILMFVTFVSIGVLPVEAGASVVMGANFGSATLPIWLSRGMSPAARRIPYGNLFLRGIGSVLGLLVINLTPALDLLSFFPAPQILVSVHLIFNLALLLISLPLVRFFEAPLVAMFPERGADDAGKALQPGTALDPRVTDQPRLAIAALKREVLRMSQLIEAMARPVMEVYESGDADVIEQVRDMDHEVNAMLSAIRRYAASIPREKMTKEQNRKVRELTEYSINLETAGDIISKRLMDLAEEKARKRLQFTREGWSELRGLHERVMSNMALAFNVLVSEDIESARLLVQEKTEMSAQERKSRKKHLKRLREGLEQSFESSDVHLETVRSLKDLNSQIAAVAYPILYRHGQLLETRLVHTMDEAHAAQGGGKG